MDAEERVRRRQARKRAQYDLQRQAEVGFQQEAAIRRLEGFAERLGHEGIVAALAFGIREGEIAEGPLFRSLSRYWETTEQYAAYLTKRRTLTEGFEHAHSPSAPTPREGNSASEKDSGTRNQAKGGE